MAKHPTVRYVAAVLVLSAACGLTARAYGQVAPSDQLCITTFNKGLGKIAKAQGQAVGRCVSDFAAGRLVSTTPETCLVTDLFGRLNSTITRAASSISSRVRCETSYATTLYKPIGEMKRCCSFSLGASPARM